MTLSKRHIFYFDWLSFFLTWTIASIGLLFVYSATTTQAIPFSIHFQKQLFGFISGFIVYWFFCLTDYRKLCRTGYFLYFLMILILGYTLIKGKIGMGAQRWIDLKLFRFQPSELAKLFLPPFFTYFLYTENDVPIYTLETFFPILACLGISSLLILRQPDLGTALVVAGSGLILLWFAGIGKKFFRYGLLCCILSMPLCWTLLKTYQKQRIMVFLGAGDNRKERYQIEQSKIAIGSGGIFGKGFVCGTQNTLFFLPESRTDFIFSVLCEEWGFVGGVLLLILYLSLFLRIFYRLEKVKTFFAKLLGIGLILPVLLSAFINIAMVCGLLPIVGIPLPLMSYGITSLWITCAGLGWIQGIILRMS
ncbi:rod shape-determining protein RodA [Candidatus Babeliales bacterium]|nr:rod shape-determining protein RodA [Candidatus Babeliales bacterium]